MAPARVVALLMLTCLVAAGCSGTSPRPTAQSASASPDRADSQCRLDWFALGQRFKGFGQGAYPSDLRTRWTSVLASIDYYAHSAQADDCDAPLSEQKQAAARIKRFTTSLRVYDTRYRLAHVRDAAASYLKHPVPPGKKKPPKKLVRLALKLAKKTAPAAVRDMRDGWAQAETVDLSNDTARKKALQDMRFLAGDSLPFQQADAALRVLAKTR